MVLAAFSSIVQPPLSPLEISKTKYCVLVPHPCIPYILMIKFNFSLLSLRRPSFKGGRVFESK
jgi:hypothetical protein